MDHGVRRGGRETFHGEAGVVGGLGLDIPEDTSANIWGG